MKPDSPAELRIFESEENRKKMKKTDPHLMSRPRGGIDDVFYNQFDITWAKHAPEEPGFPKVLTKLPVEVAEDDGTVTYTFNNEFFRSDDFTPNHEPGKHILFAGCSQTEGVGAPIDTVWSKVFIDRLNERTGGNYGFYSIARSGFGWQKVITHFMTYMDKYGTPDYLFVLLPNIGRFFEWSSKDNCYYYIQRYMNGGRLSPEQLDEDKIPHGIFMEKPLTEEEQRKSFVDFSVSWKLFERYCESLGVKLIWGSWDYEENKNYELVRLSKNYISLSNDGLLNFIKEKRPDGKIGRFDLLRRDGHAGSLINEYWTSEFEKAVASRGWL